MSTAKRRMRRITMDILRAAGTKGRSPEAATTPITTGEQWTQQDSEEEWQLRDTGHVMETFRVACTGRGSGSPSWVLLTSSHTIRASWLHAQQLSETNIKIAWPRRNYLSNNFIVPGMITTNNTSLRKSKTDTEERKQLETHHSWLVFVAFLRADM